MDVIPDDGAPRAREVLRGGCACDVARASPTSPRVVASLVALAMLGARRRSKRPTAG